MQEKISVIIPIYNVEKYLCQCLDSVTNQTYRNLEIILVDDGSPDRCGEICDQYAAQDDRITVIHKQNEGLCAARNTGMDVADGDWIIFFDSDDWCEADYFEKMIGALQGRSADVICAGSWTVDREEKEKVSCVLQKPFYFDTHEQMVRLAIRTLAIGYPLDGFARGMGFSAPWNKMFRLSFLRENDLHFETDLRMNEDGYFNLCAFSKATCVVGTPLGGYHYRMVPTSITKGFNPNRPAECLVCMRKTEDLRLSAFRQEAGMLQAIHVFTVGVLLSAIRCYFFNPNNQDENRRVKEKLHTLLQEPLVCRALRSKNDDYFTLKERLLKYLLRSSWLWPLRLGWGVNVQIKRCKDFFTFKNK